MARGIAARINGDKFLNGDTEFVVKQTFVKSFIDYNSEKQNYNCKIEEFFPKRGRPKYSLGILLASIHEEILFVKHLCDVGDGSAFGKWQNKEFAEQTGFTYNSIVAKKESLPYKPANLVGDSTLALFDIKDVVLRNCESYEVSNQFKDSLYQAFISLEKKELPIFKDCLSEHTAIRDYIGEILAPMALYNNVGVDGINLETMIKKHSKMLPLIKYQTCTNANLIDSYLIWPDKKIGLSSKGEEGASASLVSLLDMFEDLQKTNIKRYKILSKAYKKEIEFLTTLVEFGMKTGPLVAANKLDIISKQDLTTAIELLGQGAILDKLELDSKDESNEYRKEVNYERFGDTTLASEYDNNKSKFSSRVYDLLEQKRVRNPEKSRFEYLLLATIAKAVANKLNHMNEMNVPQFLFEVLKSIDFIQIHAKTKAIGNDIHFVAFETIYPPVYKGKVLVEADKCFYSTKQPQGGFGFKFLS